jgi:hypothetical protein
LSIKLANRGFVIRTLGSASEGSPMTTRRTPIKRAARGRQITASVIAKYLRLRELDALGLPHDDPRMQPHGEHDMLTFDLHRRFGLQPWDDPAKFEEVAERLAQAAGVTRLHPDGAYDLT